MSNELKKTLALLTVALFIGGDTSGIADASWKASRRLFAEQGETETLNVYNWEDYIAVDEVDPTTNKVTQEGLVNEFEDYCLNTLGKKVQVNYSTFDTNETMLAELKTGKAKYDLVCPSDYVIQKMVAENLIVPYDQESTPNYDKYVSHFVKDKMDGISINGVKGVVSQYARGYMWGTLGILFNDKYRSLDSRGITAKEMDSDMHSWLSLWDKKYTNLLSIKDSMRDTYAVGIMKAYDQDFELDGKQYKGFATLKKEYEAGTLAEADYNASLTALFNMCDDVTIGRVETDLKKLRDNAFGFEVDSGKTDMIKGDKFAINVAWSGDAAFAMDQSDKYNAAHASDPNYDPTILKFVLPDSGANVWFDGWVIPSNVQHKELAEEFVDFLSVPANAAQNMNYIGYTSVIAGDDILNLIKSWYDLRWDDSLNNGEGGTDDTTLTNLTEVQASAIPSLTDEQLASSYYRKDIAYFFTGTLENYSIDAGDASFCLMAESKDRQFDSQYPDATVLPTLAVMADFGSQNASMLLMWENVKNTALPVWGYILIALGVVAIIAVVIVVIVRHHAVKVARKKRLDAQKKITKAN